MKEDIIIYVNSKTSMIDKNQSVIGISNENIVSNIIFKFEDGFVDGTARLELIKPDETKGMILMNKEEESYTLPIKSSLLDQEGKLYLQLRITKEKEGEEIPIFKSKMFYLVVNESINAEEEIPEQYPTWIEIFDEKIAEINSKIEEVDNIDISQERVEDGVEITITSKDGSSTIEKVYDGEKGEQGEQGIQGIDGKDAIINGVNTLNIVEGEGIKLEQIGSNLKITSTGGYDDTEIRQEIDEIQEEVAQLDKDITNVDNRVTALGEELQDQELTLNHLDDVKANKTEIPDVSEFIKKTVDNLVNYYKKSETYTQAEVNQLIGAIKTVSIKVLPERPQTGEANIIYLIPSTKTEPQNIYDEWIYVDNKWELIGTTQVDLSNYYNKEEINTILFDYITSNDLEETLKDYVKNTDYASKNNAGVIKIDTNLGTGMATDGRLYAHVKTYNQYLTSDQATFISKKTLENVIEGKELINKNYVDEKVSEIELFKFPNAIIHGNPTINNGQVSGFSSENYLSLPSIFNLHDRGFEFNFAFRTNSDVNTAQNILGSQFCMALYIQNGKIRLRVSSNGSSWDIVDIEGSIDIQPNTTYYVQIYFDKLTYKLRYSLDGIDYTDIASVVASVSPYPKQIYLGIGNNFHNPFAGIINLNKCNLKVNRSVVWQGMDDAGLSTRMATDMENIDELGIAYINSLIDAKVSSVLESDF